MSALKSTECKKDIIERISVRERLSSKVDDFLKS